MSDEDEDIRTELAVLRERVDAMDGFGSALQLVSNEMTEHVVDIKGRNGDNGKLGELRRSLASLYKRLWWAVTIAVGSLGTAGAIAYHSGLEVGRLETKIEQLTEQVQRVHRRDYWLEGPTEKVMP